MTTINLELSCAVLSFQSLCEISVCLSALALAVCEVSFFSSSPALDSVVALYRCHCTVPVLLHSRNIRLFLYITSLAAAARDVPPFRSLIFLPIIIASASDPV